MPARWGAQDTGVSGFVHPLRLVRSSKECVSQRLKLDSEMVSSQEVSSVKTLTDKSAFPAPHIPPLTVGVPETLLPVRCLEASEGAVLSPQDCVGPGPRFLGGLQSWSQCHFTCGT